jgi:histidinol-phosphate phosphatase family protein
VKKLKKRFLDKNFNLLNKHDFLNQIDKSWTLFLDRDGVINRRPVDDYVKNWDEFEFLPGVLEAIKNLSGIFRKIIVVTNQQGIGKGLMTVEGLADIHQKMVLEIEKYGGRVDAVYFCPNLKGADENCRKPGIAMAELAKRDFPEIDFEKSIMAGDMESDMAFGRNAGMKTVFVNTNKIIFPENLVDSEYENLLIFSQLISAND